MLVFISSVIGVVTKQKTCDLETAYSEFLLQLISVVQQRAVFSRWAYLPSNSALVCFRLHFSLSVHMYLIWCGQLHSDNNITK